jgi:hypothetical protein
MVYLIENTAWRASARLIDRLQEKYYYDKRRLK